MGKKTPTLIIWVVDMKEKIASLVNEAIQELNVFVDDAFIDTEEGKKRFNIVLDSDEVIDWNRIKDASRTINKITDNVRGLVEKSREYENKYTIEQYMKAPNAYNNLREKGWKSNKRANCWMIWI